jgi:hypothetical protein
VSPDRKDYEMQKGFPRQPQADEPATPVKNYITRSGLQRLKDEHRFLLTRERPAVVEVVAWAGHQWFPRRLKSRVDWFALQRKHSEYTLVNSAEWFLVNESLQCLQSQSKLPHRK